MKYYKGSLIQKDTVIRSRTDREYNIGAQLILAKHSDNTYRIYYVPGPGDNSPEIELQDNWIATQREAVQKFLAIWND